MTNAQIFGREWLQSSFVTPVPTPAYYPSDAPLVCVQFNADWLPLIIGCLTQLTQPAAWQGSDGDQDASVQCANDLIGIFSEAYGVGACSMIQLTNGCLLQESTDGGVTWTTVSGWAEYAASCFVGPPGVPGSMGPIGPSSPGVPPLQDGQTTLDLACAVSGYLAQNVIRNTLQFLISGIEASQAVADIATAVFTAFIGGPGLAVLATTAVNGLYQAITGGTLSEYTDAESDDTLWADVTCAIFTATSGTGYVNDDNFADVLTNIAAITYAHPAVITALVAYLTQGGPIYLETVQIPGALAVVDCSGCGTYCYNMDFVTSDGGWESDTVDGTGATYVPGVGWTSAVANNGAYIKMPLGSPIAVHEVTLDATVVPIGTSVVIAISLAGSFITASQSSGAGFNELIYDFGGAMADTLYLQSGNSTGGSSIIKQVTFKGPGSVSPFGASNC